MRSWILIFILLVLNACSVKVDTRVPLDYKTPKSSFDKSDYSRYQTLADNPNAFWWPRTINESNHQAMVQTLKAARELSSFKSDYLRVKLDLKKKFRQLDCDCILYDNCRNPKDPDADMKVCEETQDHISRNDERLGTLYEKLMALQESLQLAGGEWIDEPFVELNLQSATLKFNEMQIPLKLEKYPESLNLTGELILGPSSETIFRINIDLQTKQNYLDVIGSIEEQSGDNLRKGMILFQMPEILQ